MLEKLIYQIRNLGSKYDLNFCNFKNRIIKNLTRSINHVEAWHRVINGRIGIKHPNIAFFISTILSTENFEKHKINHFFNGNIESSASFSPTKRKTRILIKNGELIDAYDNILSISRFNLWPFD